MLQRRGVVNNFHVQHLAAEVNQICSDGLVSAGDLVDSPRPLLHYVLAASLSKHITDVTPDSFLHGLSRNDDGKRKLHTQLYAFVKKKAAVDSQKQLQRRVESVGLSWNPIKDNLGKLPRCIPQGYCITYMKYILNGLLTTAQMRFMFMHEVVVADCPFCGSSNGDDRRHWVDCPVIHQVFDELYGGQIALSVTHVSFHLQVPMNGRELQLHPRHLALQVCYHAGVCVQRCAIAHFRAIFEDPWIHGAPLVLARVERRAHIGRTPHIPPNTLVYFFDAASRKSETWSLASYGAILRDNGVVVARIAVYLGEQTNDEAKYQGALRVLRHALATRCPRVCIYGDSMLVFKQLCGQWKCKTSNLTSFYEEGLELMRRLYRACDVGVVAFGHVYREFNADADSLAKEAINRRTHGYTVVNDNWE